LAGIGAGGELGLYGLEQCPIENGFLLTRMDRAVVDDLTDIEPIS
jgi:hypothetical protein